MTAEIIVMNKMAIAMAADSAVTIGQKIYNSANKLFTLSKYHPVGIMIYGNASFMDIPWETIIKVYRQKLGKKKFDTLEEYANHFTNSLGNNNPLFPETEQSKYFLNATAGYFMNIITAIRKSVEDFLKKNKKIKDSEIKRVVASVIKNHFDTWNKCNILQAIPKAHSKNLIRKYESEIEKIIKDVFEKIPLSKKLIKQLKQISGHIFSKDLFPSRAPGIVIAGFGDKEIFPSYRSFIVECIVDNRLKFRNDKDGTISFDNNALISPFAQSEMVATFMEGIDPDLQKVSESSLKSIFDEYSELVTKNIQAGSEDEKQKIINTIKVSSKKILDAYVKEMAAYRRKSNVTPILSAVSVLPKDELASMAEALVNCNSKVIMSY